MPQFAAVLGHQPNISLAELSAVTSNLKVVRTEGKFLTLFSTDTDLTTTILTSIGGTVFLARQIVSSGSLTLDDLPALIASETQGVKGKVTFSFRTYGLGHHAIHDLYRKSKARLKDLGRPSRYIGTDSKPAAAVLLHDAGVLDGSHGCELFLIATKNAESEEMELWIGKTIFAQDVDAYAKRDMQKPARDTTVGLLPPKLAQILLNFGAWAAGLSSGGKTDALKKFTVMDPFCGMGVIPMEALLKGWNVVASDVSQKAVNACERNIEWLRKEEKILKRDANSTVSKHDATKPFEDAGDVDCIVTETSLGPNLENRPTIRDAQKWKNENERLQAAFLKAAAESYPTAPIVCTWPVWFHAKGEIHLEKAWDVLHDLGYRATLPPGVEPDVPGRLSLVYRRPEQCVGREIVILQPRN